MELIDVLDENGLKTGEVLSREEVHQKGLCHKIVIIAGINNKNEILLQQRSKTKSSDSNKWDLTAAGHVLSGEESNYAISRELKEELNYEVDPENIKPIISFKKDCHIFDFFILKTNHLDITKLKLQESEVQDVKLVNIDELNEMIKNNLVIEGTECYEKLFEYLSQNN